LDSHLRRMQRGLVVSLGLSQLGDVEVERDAELVVTGSVGDAHLELSARVFGGVGPEGDVSKLVVSVHERVGVLIDAVLLLVEDSHAEWAVADRALEAQEVRSVELRAVARPVEREEGDESLLEVSSVEFSHLLKKHFCLPSAGRNLNATEQLVPKCAHLRVERVQVGESVGGVNDSVPGDAEVIVLVALGELDGVDHEWL